MSVSRERYEKAKEAAKIWHTMLCKVQEDNDNFQVELEKWKKLCSELPDKVILEELESSNKNLSKLVKSLKKQLLDNEENYKNKIANLEREKLLYEGRIQQLEETRKDLQERYNELKQDFREQQRWMRKENI